MSQEKREYPKEITENGTKFGYKAANLMFLESIVEEFNRKNPDGNIQVAVPSFESYSSHIIENELDICAPEWRSKWRDFVKVFNEENPIIAGARELSGSEDKYANEDLYASGKNTDVPLSNADPNVNSNKVVGPNSKEALKRLAIYIEKCVIENQSHLIKPLAGLSESGLLMVRSSGSEDSITIANPGGNASYPALNNEIDIEIAYAGVLRSYFELRAIQQRISGGEYLTKNPPSMGVFIETFIGERLFGNDSKDAEIESKGRSSSILKTARSTVVSGVMYSKEGSLRIQAAPGHGELIVNSKGNFDSFYVTPDGMIYAEKQIKHDRIVPSMESSVEEDGTVRMRATLKSIPNPTLDQYEFSLPPEVTYQLYELSKFIEEKYGMPMDTEFVYDTVSKTINIVQTRAIPEGNMKGVEPSALSPEIMSSLPKENKLKANTITKEVNNARVISSKESVIVSDTIEEALTLYNNTANKKSIKAVIINKSAPDTGHEAGEFRSKAMAVLQVDDLDKVRTMLDSAELMKLVIDPQRKSIWQLPEEYAKAMEDDIIKEGLYSSTLSSDVSAYVSAFTKIKAEQIELMPELMSLKDESLGELIFHAHSDAPNIAIPAINKISSFIFNNIKDAYGYLGKDVDSKGSQVQEFAEEIQALSSPDLQKLDETKFKVTRSLKTVHDLRKEEMISQEVFVQTMLSGAEMLMTIEKMAELIAENKDADISKNSVYSQYLDVSNKFQGLILSRESSPEVLGSSVMKDLAKYHHEKEVREFIESNNLAGETKDVFLEAAKLSQFFINYERKEQWLEFCAETCKDEESAKRLADIVGNIVKNGIAPQWCNLSVAPLLRESTNHVATLQAIDAEFKELQESMGNINEIDQLIREIKSQKALWNEPEKFEKLYENFKTKFDQAKAKIKFNESDPVILQIMTSKQMMDLVDSIDLTLKTLGTSTLYTDKQKQAENFREVLTDFNELLNEWLPDIELYKEAIDNDEKVLEDINGEDNNIAEIQGRIISNQSKIRAIEAIKDCAKRLLERNATELDLSLSPEFNVSAAIIDREGITCFDEIFDKCTTLQDIFTLIHQNLLVSVALKNKNVISALELGADFNEKRKLIEENFIYERNNIKTRFKLVSSKIEEKKIIFDYNIPLRGHSATAQLIFDSSTKETIFAFKIFGANELCRWNISLDATFINLFLLKRFDFVDTPKYDNIKEILTLSVDISNLVISDIEGILNSIKTDILDTSFHYTTKALEAALKGMAQKYYDIKDLGDDEPEKCKFLTLLDNEFCNGVKWIEMLKLISRPNDRQDEMVKKILNVETARPLFYLIPGQEREIIEIIVNNDIPIYEILYEIFEMLEVLNQEHRMSAFNAFLSKDSCQMQEIINKVFFDSFQDHEKEELKNIIDHNIEKKDFLVSFNTIKFLNLFQSEERMNALKALESCECQIIEVVTTDCIEHFMDVNDGIKMNLINSFKSIDDVNIISMLHSILNLVNYEFKAQLVQIMQSHIDKIEALTSSDALRLLAIFNSDEDKISVLKTLAEFEIDKIQALTCIQTYFSIVCCGVSFEEIKGFSLDQIKQVSNLNYTPEQRDLINQFTLENLPNDEDIDTSLMGD